MVHYGVRHANSLGSARALTSSADPFPRLQIPSGSGSRRGESGVPKLMVGNPRRFPGQEIYDCGL